MTIIHVVAFMGSNFKLQVEFNSKALSQQEKLQGVWSYEDT